MTTIKERPILFSAPMVRAILDGRKTQTRRIIKPQPIWIAEPNVAFKTEDCNPNGIIKCPYGKPGDRLWVRETWSKAKSPMSSELFYRADGETNGKQLPLSFVERESKWRPSIYMPRWASRILLENGNVRIERLNDISEDDAIAEGIKICPNMNGMDGSVGYVWPDSDYDRNGLCNSSAVTAFLQGWEIINGPGSWNLNPWVWVVEMSAIKERPILFSAPMVRAILDERKTQTRRIIKPQPIWIAEPSVPFRIEWRMRHES